MEIYGKCTPEFHSFEPIDARMVQCIYYGWIPDAADLACYLNTDKWEPKEKVEK